ncbi:hypothetical protein [Bacillus sp. T33-2]|uniref:hypothetical protein n=1 Tax=Bacillus sp. T33-2 TaxID=2054168 RepID=UPI000CAF05A8|nr:hypothetical protein [Bacillus sp. T33-2]PLR91666.1 hypothetical protein CVD19_21615 [Bacillus sp. T33-2]
MSFIGFASLASFVIWFVAIQELLKPEKKQRKRKIITLTFAGSILTLVLTISLFQNIPF